MPTRRSLRLSFRPSWDQKKFSAQKQLAHMYLSKLQICIWDKKKVLCTKTNLYLLKLQICICLFCQINLCKLHNVFVFPAELRQEKSSLHKNNWQICICLSCIYVFVHVIKCICLNCKMYLYFCPCWDKKQVFWAYLYLYKLQACICPSCKMYLSFRPSWVQEKSFPACRAKAIGKYVATRAERESCDFAENTEDNNGLS